MTRYSSMPAVDEFDYTFDHLTEVIAGFIDAICASQQRFAIANHIRRFMTTHVVKENIMLAPSEK